MVKLYLKAFTLKKAINALKVFYSYHYSRITKNPFISGYPISIAIEPTTSCNLRCPECPSGLRSFTRPTGMLTNELFSQMIDSMQSTLSYLTFYFQGEPYLNKNFLEMVSIAHKRNIITSTSTNAHYLDDETARKTVVSGLSKLVVSLDGTDAETYEKYRVGGDLQKVKEGIQNLVKWKKQLRSNYPIIDLQFIVFKHNQHQIDDIKKLGKELQVNRVSIKTAQVYDYENGSELIPTIDRYSRYKLDKNGRYHIKSKLLNQCWRMWQSCVITWDGKIVPCCFDKDAKYQLGSINKNSFKEIWKGASYQKFRASLLKSRSEIDICKNCTEGLSVFSDN